MTKQELLEILDNCRFTGTEEAHGAADDALISYIADPEIAEAYRAVPKWYA